MRSRAVSFPLSCWRRKPSASPCAASYFRCRSWLIFFSIGSIALWGLISDQLGRFVFAENAAERVGALANRRVGSQRLLQRRHHVVAAASRLLEPLQRLLNGSSVPLFAQAPKRLDLLLFTLRPDLHDLDRLARAGLELVDSNHDPLGRFQPLLKAIGALADPSLHPAGLDHGDGATKFIDLGHQPLG